MSGKAMPSGSVMSRPCAQCSASRVVASVAGLSGASAHCKRRSGSAARERVDGGAAGETPTFEDHQRVRPFSSNLTLDCLIHRLAFDAPIASVCDVDARRGCEGHAFLGLGEMQHNIGNRPAWRPRLSGPGRCVERGEDALESILLGDEVSEDVH